MYTKIISETDTVIRKKLSEKRYSHSCRTADMCASFALRFHIDEDKAYLAGLGHDIMRESSPKRVNKWAGKASDTLWKEERESPVLLHALAGANYFKFKLGFDDPDFHQALRAHTCGEPDMNLLAKILFAADYMEPGRKHLDNRERSLLLQLDLDFMIVRIHWQMLNYLIKKKLPSIKKTMASYESILGEIYRNER